MKFLLDENAERRLLSYLKELGHDATAVGIDYPSGMSDEEVLDHALEENRILITNDRSDFGKLIFKYHQPHRGVILLRIPSRKDITLKKTRLLSVIKDYSSQLRNFVVVTQRRVKVRKTPSQMAA